jgi:hypothetical protein
MPLFCLMIHLISFELFNLIPFSLAFIIHPPGPGSRGLAQGRIAGTGFCDF